MTSRLRIALGLLVALSLAGTVRAQAPEPAPVPPAPGRVDSPPLEGPLTDLEPITEGRGTREEAAPTRDTNSPAMSHDALQTGRPRPTADRAYSPKPPPAPIAERPAGPRPQRRAEWVPGYWDWDPSRAEFVWMGGIWQVPTPGTIWVGSQFLRDGGGWYRRPGFWSRRRGPVAVATTFSDPDPDARPPAWRTTGPPAEHPADKVADAPGPDYFLIPGHFAPDGDQLRWKPGFWAREQAGWDWIPARWVRRPSGWEFRAGHWVREPGGVDVNVTVGGRTTARVITPGTVDPHGEPSEILPDPATGAPPLPPGTEDEIDPIAQAEAAGRVRGELPRIVVAPVRGMPYYVIRPPGSYPYGPGGVIVPGAVPPFVRRILDQVLP
jgi:WXXGXW repeat (2 copies)